MKIEMGEIGNLYLAKVELTNGKVSCHVRIKD